MKPARRFRLTILALFCCLPAWPQATPQSNPPDIPGLLQKLVDSDEVERRALMEQFDQINDPQVLVPPVLAALDTVDPQDAWKLLDVLARFSSYAKPDPLIRLAFRSDRVPDTLAPQLISIGAPARIALLNAISDTCVTWKPEPPRMATESERESYDSGPEALRSRRFIRWAARTLESAGPAGLEDLLKLLDSRDACHASAAQEGITDYILEGPPTVSPPLLRTLSDALRAKDPTVQKTALLIVEPMLGFHHADLSPRIRDSLFTILKSHPDVEARSVALGIFLYQVHGDLAKKAANIAQHDPDERLQNEAFEFLEKLAEQEEPER